MNFNGDATRLGQFDIAPLRAAVEQISEAEWLADQARQQTFDAHRATQTLKLIFDADYRHTDPTVHADYHRFEPLIAPMLTHIRGYYTRTLRQRRVAERHGPGYVIRAILTRLLPASAIKPHADGGYSLMRCHRIHLPIVTNPQCQFSVGDLSFVMPEGELWEINNRRVHSVRNDGTAARVHLIIDYVQPGETVFDTEAPLTA